MKRYPIKRFWDKVKKSVGCWEWLAAKTKDGYGLIGMDGKMPRAHRFAWTLVYGEIPEGMHVLHSCDNPACVRVGHLWLGTDADNHADCVRKGRRSSFRGEANGRALLTEEQVAEIRERTDMPALTIARAFMISRATIYDIRAGKTWKPRGVKVIR